MARVVPEPKSGACTPQGGKKYDTRFVGMPVVFRDAYFDIGSHRCADTPTLVATRAYWAVGEVPGKWMLLAPVCSACGGSSSYKGVERRVRALVPSVFMDRHSTWSMFVKGAQCCGATTVLWGNGLPCHLRACEMGRSNTASMMLPPVTHDYWRELTMDAFLGPA